MRKLANSVLALGFAFGTASQAEGPNRLITVLTAPEAQTQLMAMVLTMNAMAAGAEAEMLLCGPAGDIALKEAPASATAGQPPRGQPARSDENDDGKERLEGAGLRDLPAGQGG